jgi:hypothetical protein
MQSPVSAESRPLTPQFGQKIEVQRGADVYFKGIIQVSVCTN